jgi:hypothetical protein
VKEELIDMANAYFAADDGYAITRCYGCADDFEMGASIK